MFFVTVNLAIAIGVNCGYCSTLIEQSSYTVRGKNLEGEKFGESLLMKQMARKILANLLASLQL